MQVKFLAGMIRNYYPGAHHVRVRWQDTGQVQRAQVLPSDKQIYGRTEKEAVHNAEELVRSMQRLHPNMYFKIIA